MADTKILRDRAETSEMILMSVRERDHVNLPKAPGPQIR
jgi:hypothetical protein